MCTLTDDRLSAQIAALSGVAIAGTLATANLGIESLVINVLANQDNDLRRAWIFRHLTDERRLDVVEQLVPPGTDIDIGTLDQAYQPPALENPGLRRPLAARLPVDSHCARARCRSRRDSLVCPVAG